MAQSITLLAIESSCDETSAAVIHNGEILSNIIANQLVHEEYGGVVPELASREHQKNIVPTVQAALKKANIQPSELHGIAFTQGPGLLGSLLVGSSFAKSFAMALGIPVIGVNHMQAHILAHFIEEPRPKFPFLCLTVSGGHTQLVKVKDPLTMEIIGETRDDAVGEAFDKTAKMLGLPYPGGPLIDQYAQKGDVKFKFTIADIPDLDFSFSGIKTGVLYFLQKQVKENPDFIAENLADICASIQHNLVETLMQKLGKAVKTSGITRVAIAGGVSANSELRRVLTQKAEEHRWESFIPRFEYCTDNAAMIAMAAHFRFLEGKFDSLQVSPNPRMKF